MSNQTSDVSETVLDLTDPDDQAPRPMLTIREAAEAADVSDKTIRRRLDSDELPGSVLDETGSTPIWRIPVEALLVAGFTLNAPTSPEKPAIPPEPESDALTQAQTEIDRLQDRLTETENRAKVAEAIATERARSLEDMRGAMRMLEAAQPAPPPPAPPTPQPVRRWWSRNR